MENIDVVQDSTVQSPDSCRTQDSLEQAPIRWEDNGAPRFTREFLTPLSVKELKTLAQEQATARKHRSSWVATTNKEALVNYLVTGELPVSGSLPTNGQQTPSIAQYDLAAVMANALSPFMNVKAQIDEQAVQSIIDSRFETINALIEARVAEVVAPKVRTIEVKRLDGTVINVGVQHKQFDELKAYVEQRMNVYLVGPAASGKTHVAKSIAEALGLKYYADSVCAQTPLSALFGFINAAGQYVPTKFRLAYEFGGIYLLDEFDNGNANTCAALNQATANGECGFPDGMVKKHADFIAIAAGNTFGNGADRQYVGRNQLDAATLDRFIFLDWEYDEALELAISPNQEWTKYVQAVRHSVAKLKIRHVVSVRASLIGGTMINAGVPCHRIAQTVLWKGLSPEEIDKIIANVK